MSPTLHQICIQKKYEQIEVWECLLSLGAESFAFVSFCSVAQLGNAGSGAPSPHHPPTLHTDTIQVHVNRWQREELVATN